MSLGGASVGSTATGGSDVDIFRFTNPVSSTKMEAGHLINNTLSKEWIERYLEPGEFTITGDGESFLHAHLPVGTYIGKVDSDEIMVVENVEIEEEKGKPGLITVTGRSLEVIFEERVVGSDQAYPTTGGLTKYTIPAWKSWIQVESIMRRHIEPGYVTNPVNEIDHFEVRHTCTGSGTEEAREINRGTVHSTMLKLLEVDKLGIRVIRPGRPGGSSTDGTTSFVIHQGNDIRNSVLFRYDLDELLSARYLFSIKKMKTAAYVYGKYVDVLVNDGGYSGDQLRVLPVNASDIDEDQPAAPTGTARDLIVAAMTARGREQLQKNNAIVLAEADIDPYADTATFREDYYLGDIVTVDGNYQAATPMRVTEFVEIEDETGYTGYPTLSLLG